MVFNGFFLLSCGEMSPWCGQEGDLPHQLMLARCGQSVIVCPLTVWFSLLQCSATVDFFLCVFCPFGGQVRALLYFLIVHWMRSIAPSVQSNIAPSVYCVFSGFLFVAIPPLHSLSLLIYGPWWVPALGGHCLDALLLFLQVSFFFCGGSGAVIYSTDGWPFVWNGVIWGPQQVMVCVSQFPICLYSDVSCAAVLYLYVLDFFASSSCVKILPGYLIKLSLPDVWKR